MRRMPGMEELVRSRLAGEEALSFVRNGMMNVDDRPLMTDLTF